MSVNYNPRYYCLDLIPDYRQKFIDIRLKQFINEYKITKWPIDTIKLLKKIKKKKLLNIRFYSVPGTSSAFDAQVRYYPDEDLYMFLVNKQKVKYPFRSSKDRRLNFTLAHEIGHIMLGHLSIPDHLKTVKQKMIEEEEANEFAGRLLMPEPRLLSCNFVSHEKVAEYFNVSIQALWKRLNHLKRLDILSSPDPLIVCEECGNSEISPFTDYCKICGCIINNPQGVEIMKYSGYELRDDYRFVKCPICDNEEYSERAEYCKICGASATNYCTNCGQPCDGNARFCERCKVQTYLFKEGMLKSWEEERATIKLMEIINEDAQQSETHNNFPVPIDKCFDYFHEKWKQFVFALKQLDSSYFEVLNIFELYDCDETNDELYFILDGSLESDDEFKKFDTISSEVAGLFSKFANLHNVKIECIGVKPHTEEEENEEVTVSNDEENEFLPIEDYDNLPF